MSAWYTVAVSLPPQTVRVWAQNHDDAIDKAVWCVGIAGMRQLGKHEIVAAEYGEPVSPRTGTAA